MPALIDREKIYRSMWEHTDRMNFLKITQQEFAKEFGIGYQRLSEIVLEFIKCGRIKKFKSRFQLKDPDTLDWGEDYLKWAEEFRASRGR